MATNKIFAETQSKNRERLLSGISNPTTPPTSILPGVPVTFGAGNIPAVSLTASPNATRTDTLADGSTLTYNIGGVGNQAGAATFAFDGSFEFAVTGAATNTLNDVEVFIVPATGALTLTSTSNVHYGWTDYPRDYVKTAGRAVVRVGK